MAQTHATEDQGQFSLYGYWPAYTSNELAGDAVADGGSELAIEDGEMTVQASPPEISHTSPIYSGRSAQ